MKKCPECNHELKRIENGTLQAKHKTSNGCKDILVENLSYSKCDYCNEIFYNPDDLDNYEIQLEKALEKERKSENLLTAKEIKAIRKKYNLTQLQLELLLKIGPKNVAKWETYKSNQSKTIDKLLRNMNDDYCFFLKMLNNFCKNDKISDDLKQYFLQMKADKIDLYYTKLNKLSTSSNPLDILTERISYVNE